MTERWNRFWFATVDGSTWVLVRTVFGIVLLGWSLSLLADMSVLFGGEGLAELVDGDRRRLIAVLNWVDHEALAWMLVVLLIAAAVLLIAGKAVRVMAPLAAVCFLSLINSLGPWLIGAEMVIQLLATYIGLYALLTPERLLGGALWRPDSIARVTPLWGLRLLQIQFSLAYLTTALDKVRGASWREGYAVYWALSGEDLWRFTPPEWLLDSRILIALATWGTLALEFALPVGLWWPRTRPYAVAAAILMHAMFDPWFELGFFGWAMTVGVLSFAPPGTMRRIIEWPRTRRDGAAQATASGSG